MRERRRSWRMPPRVFTGRRTRRHASHPPPSRKVCSRRHPVPPGGPARALPAAPRRGGTHRGGDDARLGRHGRHGAPAYDPGAVQRGHADGHLVLRAHGPGRVSRRHGRPPLHRPPDPGPHRRGGARPALRPRPEQRDEEELPRRGRPAPGPLRPGLRDRRPVRGGSGRGTRLPGAALAGGRDPGEAPREPLESPVHGGQRPLHRGAGPGLHHRLPGARHRGNPLPHGPDPDGPPREDHPEPEDGRGDPFPPSPPGPDPRGGGRGRRLPGAGPRRGGRRGRPRAGGGAPRRGRPLRPRPPRGGGRGVDAHPPAAPGPRPPPGSGGSRGGNGDLPAGGTGPGEEVPERPPDPPVEDHLPEPRPRLPRRGGGRDRLPPRPRQVHLHPRDARGHRPAPEVGGRRERARLRPADHPAAVPLLPQGGVPGDRPRPRPRAEASRPGSRGGGDRGFLAPPLGGALRRPHGPGGRDLHLHRAHRGGHGGDPGHLAARGRAAHDPSRGRGGPRFPVPVPGPRPAGAQPPGGGDPGPRAGPGRGGAAAGPRAPARRPRPGARAGARPRPGLLRRRAPGGHLGLHRGGGGVPGGARAERPVHGDHALRRGHPDGARDLETGPREARDPGGRRGSRGVPLPVPLAGRARDQRPRRGDAPPPAGPGRGRAAPPPPPRAGSPRSSQHPRAGSGPRPRSGGDPRPRPVSHGSHRLHPLGHADRGGGRSPPGGAPAPALGDERGRLRPAALLRPRGRVGHRPGGPLVPGLRRDRLHLRLPAVPLRLHGGHLHRQGRRERSLPRHRQRDAGGGPPRLRDGHRAHPGQHAEPGPGGQVVRPDQHHGPGHGRRGGASLPRRGREHHGPGHRPGPAEGPGLALHPPPRAGGHQGLDQGLGREVRGQPPDRGRGREPGERHRALRPEPRPVLRLDAQPLPGPPDRVRDGKHRLPPRGSREARGDGRRGQHLRLRPPDGGGAGDVRAQPHGGGERQVPRRVPGRPPPGDLLGSGGGGAPGPALRPRLPGEPGPPPGAGAGGAAPHAGHPPRGGLPRLVPRRPADRLRPLHHEHPARDRRPLRGERRRVRPPPPHEPGGEPDLHPPLLLAGRAPHRLLRPHREVRGDPARAPRHPPVHGRHLRHEPRRHGAPAAHRRRHLRGARLGSLPRSPAPGARPAPRARGARAPAGEEP